MARGRRGGIQKQREKTEEKAIDMFILTKLMTGTTRTTSPNLQRRKHDGEVKTNMKKNLYGKIVIELDLKKYIYIQISYMIR